jgi:SAM-dependent methyltransferase
LHSGTTGPITPGEYGVRAAVVEKVKAVRHRLTFRNSQEFWERRYASGEGSGLGSYGEVATYKANFLNELVSSRGVGSVLEFGCGDGNQLALAQYPRYIGLDVAPTAIELCVRRFATDPSKSFIAYDPQHFVNHGALTADMTLSLDVILHLVEDEVFERYMQDLFDASTRFVVIFSPDYDRPDAPHVRFRSFTPWVALNRPEWVLAERVTNPMAAEESDTVAHFFVYEKAASA